MADYYQMGLLFVGLTLFFGWRLVQIKRVKDALPKLLSEGAVIVDVRTVSEYSTGHFNGSLNFPLDELPKRAGSLDLQEPVIVCCASGTRSGLAAGLLRKMGFKTVVNIGSWKDLG